MVTIGILLAPGNGYNRHTARNAHLAARDESPFCIFHITNEICLHHELIDKIVVANHCQNISDT